MCLSGSRLPMISPRREGPRSASQIDSARGGAPTESTRVEAGFELLVRVPWTKSRTQPRQQSGGTTAPQGAAQGRGYGA
jgi:hypothetical protein